MHLDISQFSQTNALAFLALTVAYVAYWHSVRSSFLTHKNLLNSFKNELIVYESWFGDNKPYSESNDNFLIADEIFYSDKHYYDPNKMVFFVSSEAAQEIMRKGTGRPDFIKDLALFNQKIKTFNHFLSYQKACLTSSPVLAERLFLFLESEGYYTKDFKDEAMDNTLVKMEKEHPDLYFFAKQIFRINYKIHNRIIGNGDKDDHLNTIFNRLIKGVAEELKDLESSIFYGWFQPMCAVLQVVIGALLLCLLLT